MNNFFLIFIHLEYVYLSQFFFPYVSEILSFPFFNLKMEYSLNPYKYLNFITKCSEDSNFILVSDQYQ